MDRTEKREFVTSLAAVFADTSMVVVTRNAGLTVAEVTDLRRRMRAAGATYKVAKNRLATLALDGTRFDGIKPLLKGPTALAWAKDPVAVAKAAVEFERSLPRVPNMFDQRPVLPPGLFVRPGRILRVTR